MHVFNFIDLAIQPTDLNSYFVGIPQGQNTVVANIASSKYQKNKQRGQVLPFASTTQGLTISNSLGGYEKYEKTVKRGGYNQTIFYRP